MSQIKVVYLPGFERDLKSLLKRYPTLTEDLQVFISSSMCPFHELGIDTNGIFQLAGLGFSEPQIYKVKKFACRSMKGKGVASGIRIIYAYFCSGQAVMLEMYYKGDKENEDRERINDIKSFPLLVQTNECVDPE